MSAWTLPNGKDCVVNGIPTISCVVPLMQFAIATAITLVGTVAVVLILIASLKYITSGGGKAVEEAKNMITYAIIGLIIVLLSFFIIGLISGFTGVDCIVHFGLDPKACGN